MATLSIESTSIDQIHKLLVKAGLTVIPFPALLEHSKNSKLRLNSKMANDSQYKKKMGHISNVDILVDTKIISNLQPNKTISEEEIMKLLAKDWNIPYKHLDPINMDFNIITKYLTKETATKHLLLPVLEDKNYITFATCYRPTKEIIHFLKTTTHKTPKFFCTTKNLIIDTISRYWAFHKTIKQANLKARNTSNDPGTTLFRNLERLVDLHVEKKSFKSDEEEVVKTVDYLFRMALELNASDIHIEPKRDECVVRMRVDGLLHKITSLPITLHPSIITRVKITSGLDISEKRRPQDGRLKVSNKNIETEFRISTLPTAFGEKIVVRIFDSKISLSAPRELGFEEDDFELFNHFINQPNGVIFLTGPTGSGKTTTLYSTLKTLADLSKNVVTIEDPIEMVLPHFNQVQINPKIGITFVNSIRSILRQDPDIIMVGEARDVDTAESVIQSAITGHLVFSTLHTNDSISALIRLIELGIEPFLITSALIGIVAQRLVRKICPSCIRPVVATDKQKAVLTNTFGYYNNIQLFEGEGCVNCRNTGYKGREGIFECLPVDEALMTLIKEKADINVMKEHALRNGLKTLGDRGILKVEKGITTLKEVCRVTGPSVDHVAKKQHNILKP